MTGRRLTGFLPNAVASPQRRMTQQPGSIRRVLVA
jgi:hypothetical protein